MHIQADRALIPAHSSSVRHLTIQITAPDRKTAASERPSVNVALAPPSAPTAEWFRGCA
jgi:hypothetical protein